MTVSEYLFLLPSPLFGENHPGFKDIKAGALPALPDSLLKEIENTIRLDFLPVLGSDNLCFVQSSEVQPPFRTSFSPLQLLDALYAAHLLTQESASHSRNLYIPRTPEDFWSLEESGQQFRMLHSLDFPLPADIFELVKRTPLMENEQEKILQQKGFQAEPQQELGRIWLNPQQYIPGVPQSIWSFILHNRFPARQVLHTRSLSSADQLTGYRKTLYALMRTLELRKELQPINLHPILYQG